jgi:hypothetical protein
MGVYDRAVVLQEVRRILPDVQGIAVTGSAAFEGARFLPDSDIDVVAIGPKSGFAWGRVGGHEMEIHAMHIDLIRGRVRNPQWHLTNWIWIAGGIGGAEVLFGPSLEDLVRSQITKRTRLIAGSTLIGALLSAQNKAKSGSRPVSLDVPLVLTALRRVVSGALPIRAEPDADLKNFTVMSDFAKELENAATLGEESFDILLDNNEVQKIMYWSEHRTGLGWLRRAMGINLEMPEVGCLK